MIKLNEVVKVARGEDFADRGEVITSLTVSNSFMFDKRVSDEQKLYGINRSIGIIFENLYGEIIERLKNIIHVADLNHDLYGAIEAKKLLNDICDTCGVIEKLPENLK